MEEALLVNERGEDEKITLTWDVMKEETKKIGLLAAPMIALTLSQVMMRTVSTMMVGHLDELSLSSSAMATSMCGVTGFSFILGMACGLDTLCGQAYGAKQYQKVGIYMYSSIISLLLVCLPMSLVWINMGNILTLLGQDPMISLEAGKYAIWLIPALFANAVIYPLVRYLQSQSLILPILTTTFAVLCIHIPLCWFFIYKLGLGTLGAALTIDVSSGLHAIFLVIYIKYSSSCIKTRAPLSMKALEGIPEFLRIGFPSAIMICIEWWSYELLILLSGILPNPKLEASVLSICLTTVYLIGTIPYATGAAASIRVSNELGAGKPQRVRVCVYLVMIMAVTEAVILSVALFASRSIMGRAYSNEKEVVDYIKEMVPIICLSVIMDSLQSVLSGIARGTGWQHLGAYINLGSYYIVGVPASLCLCFLLHLRGKGLWMGIVLAATVQFVLLAFVTGCTNWYQQAITIQARLSDSLS